MNIYIGNFSYDITGDDLQDAFSAFGHVESAKVIRDKFSGQSRGFGFVDMPNTTEAQAAIKGITEIKGKRITINEAKPQAQYGSQGGQRGGARSKNFGRRERSY
jgi:RNA recognition motif-containing protein